MEEDLIVDEMEYIPTPLDIAKKKGLKRLETESKVVTLEETLDVLFGGV